LPTVFHCRERAMLPMQGADSVKQISRKFAQIDASHRLGSRGRTRRISTRGQQCGGHGINSMGRGNRLPKSARQRKHINQRALLLR
jgi:hypothetical protein